MKKRLLFTIMSDTESATVCLALCSCNAEALMELATTLNIEISGTRNTMLNLLCDYIKQNWDLVSINTVFQTVYFGIVRYPRWGAVSVPLPEERQRREVSKKLRADTPHVFSSGSMKEEEGSEQSIQEEEEDIEDVRKLLEGTLVGGSKEIKDFSSASMQTKPVQSQQTNVQRQPTQRQGQPSSVWKQPQPVQGAIFQGNHGQTTTKAVPPVNLQQNAKQFTPVQIKPSPQAQQIIKPGSPVQPVNPPNVQANKKPSTPVQLPQPPNSPSNFTNSPWSSIIPRPGPLKSPPSTTERDELIRTVALTVAATLDAREAKEVEKRQPEPNRETGVNFNALFGSKYTAFLKDLERKKIRFSGDNEETPVAYLTALSEMKEAYQLTDIEILQSVSGSLTGSALFFYTVNKGELTTWQRFHDALRKNFIPAKFDKKWRRQMEDRSQASNETLLSYLLGLQMMNRELSRPLTDPELRDLLMDGLHPEYRPIVNLLPNATLAQLKEAVPIADEERRLMRQYKPPPPALMENSKFGNPTMAKKPKMAMLQPRIQAARQPAQPVNNQINENNNAGARRRVCMNCGDDRHRTDSCPRPFVLKCYYCGRLDRTVRTCGCRGATPRVGSQQQGNDTVRSQSQPPPNM